MKTHLKVLFFAQKFSLPKFSFSARKKTFNSGVIEKAFRLIPKALSIKFSNQLFRDDSSRLDWAGRGVPRVFPGINKSV